MLATISARGRVIVASAIVFVLALAVYLPMLPAGVAIGDEAEAQTVPFMLGIAHPTGFPAYTLAGWLFSHVVAFSTVAWRLNAFAAVMTALTAVGVLLLAIAIGARLSAATFAALVFAFGTAIWAGALHANAQPLAAALGVYALLGCVVFAREGDRRFFLAGCACCGFALATHPAAIWILPALGVALAWQRRTITASFAFGAALALCLPLALYAYFPLRAVFVAATGSDPTAGAPTFGLGSIDWNMSAGRTFAGFLDELLGRHENASGSLARTFDPRVLPAIVTSWFGLVPYQYAIGVLLLAAAGTGWLASADRRAASVLFAGTAGGIAFAYTYRTDLHIGRYLVVSFAVTAALAAASSRIAIPRVSTKGVCVCIALVLGVLAGYTLLGHRALVATTTHPDGASFITAAARDLPDGAIIVADWNAAAALGYGAYVEHALGSRIIVAGLPGQYIDRYSYWTTLRRVFVLTARDGRAPPSELGFRPVTTSLPGDVFYEFVPRNGGPTH